MKETVFKKYAYYADLNRWRRDNNKITSNYCIHVEEFFSPRYLLLASQY